MMFKERKYVGQGMTVIWKANNVVDIYQNGKLAFKNVQAKEIPVPSEVEDPQNYSKFFEINLNGQVIRSALSKDESLLQIEGVGALYEVKEDKNKTYPKAYFAEAQELTLGIIVLSQSFDQGVVVLESSDGEEFIANKGRIVDCNDVKTLKSEYSNFRIQDDANVPYSKALVGDDGQPVYVYFPSVDAWTLVGTISESGVLKGFTINPPMMSYKAMSTEQINKYVEGANQQTN